MYWFIWLVTPQGKSKRKDKKLKLQSKNEKAVSGQQSAVS
jgi:hypothetical protein